MEHEAGRILNKLGVPVVSFHERVSNLSSEERQMIAIARVLTQNVRLVIIDEPTISLSYPYQQKLLNLNRRMAAKWRRSDLQQQQPGTPIRGDRPDHHPASRVIRWLI